MTETTTTTKTSPPETSRETVAEETPRAEVGTSIAIWLLYVLGIVAATVLAASLVFVALAYATSGSGGVGVHVSTPALVLWLALVIAAAGTFLWRRSRRA